MIGADAVVAALKVLDVTHVFGIISIHNMPIFDAINRDGTIHIIDCRHEMGATHAADGYARTTGKIGVVIASTGPGTTNTVTGLYEAAYASSPVLLITGQAETAYYGRHMGYVHEAENQLPMLRTVVRRAESPRLASQIEPTIIQVASDMLSGRPQPGAVELPINLQYESVEPEQCQPVIQPAPAAKQEEVAQALEMIANASKRIMVVGGGAADAQDEVRDLAEKLSAPVFTTANGRGVLAEDHNLSVGNIYASRRLHAEFADADLTIAIGTRFQIGVGGSAASLKPPGKLLHIDIDTASLNRVHRADLAIQADAKNILKELIGQLNPEPNDTTFTAKVVDAGSGVKAGLRKRIGPDYEGILNCMRNQLARDAMIVRDTTVPAYNFGNQLLEIYQSRSFVGPNSGAIGPGLPLAVGVAAGSGKKTLVIHGDGGFMLHATELATAAQYQLPIIVCVFNDGGYGVLRGLQINQFAGRFAETDLGFVDFKGLAESMGVRGYHVRSLSEFETAFAEAVGADGPVLLDIDMTALEPMQGSVLPTESR